jgi:hypothetical protein
MKKLIYVLCLSLFCFWGDRADAVNIDPYDNALAPDGIYGLLYGNYYHADEFTGPDGNKAADADLTAMVSVVRVIGYKHLGKVPLAFQVIVPFGKVEEEKVFNQKSSGIGDVIFGPGVFLYTNEASKTAISLWGYITAPTGEWDANKAINLGGNHWVFESQLAVNQLFGKFVYDMNINNYFHTKETDTQTQFPDRLELEMSLAYQITDKLIAGVNGGGFWDLASNKVGGVTVADSRSERTEIGLSTGYSFTEKLGANFRWNHDIGSQNSTLGDNFWLRFNYAF